LTKEIPLTQGKVALVDAEDYESLTQYSWYYDENGYAYRRKTTGYHKSKLVSMHREILGYIPEGKVVDHWNRDKLDNRKKNLRITSQSNNAANSPPRKGTSKFKGVYWSDIYKRWVSKIGKEGRYFHLGLYDCEINAAIAYNLKAIELYGDFAYLNKVERVEIDWSLEKPPRKTSKYIGVSKHPDTGRYRSLVKYQGKSIHLGYFKSEEMAAKFRDFWTYDITRNKEKLNFKGDVVVYG